MNKKHYMSILNFQDSEEGLINNTDESISLDVS